MTSKGCVLVVDNDGDVRQALEFRLNIAGYRVFTAASREQALELLEREVVHVVVIDVRLEDDEQPADQSGYDLARMLPNYIPHIVFTAYEDVANLKGAIEVGAVNSISKIGENNEPIFKLIQLIDEVFRSKVRVNFDLTIRSELNFDVLAYQIEVPHLNESSPSSIEVLHLNELSPPNKDDVLRILQTVFYDADEVEVKFLLPAEKAPTVSQSGSVLVLVHKYYHDLGRTEPVVVKFSALAEIRREAENFNRFAEFLRGNRRASLRGVAESRQIGGLVYSLIDGPGLDSIRTFDDVFFHYATDRVIALLQEFFGQMLDPLFNNAHTNTVNLTATYVSALRLSPEKLGTALARLHPQEAGELQIHLKGLTNAILNPLTWLRRADGFRTFSAYTRVCLCHGDLHGRNILVDASDRFWLIDFARVDLSHALRDFVELETDIKFNLLQVIDLHELLPFERALLAPARFGETPPMLTFGSLPLDKAYQVVAALRQIAAEQLDLDGDMREYYQALLFHTLNIVRLTNISDDKKEHALLAASLICQRIDDWPAWEVDLLPAVPESLPAPPPTAQEPTQLSVWSRVLAMGSFMLMGVVIAVLCLAAMSYFNPNWQQQLTTLIILAVLIIAALGVAGLVTGTTVVAALQDIVTHLLGGATVERPNHPGGGGP